MSSVKIPSWIFSCLDQYGNCACGINIVKKMGKDKLLETLAEQGYNCELEILSDQKDKTELPKDGTYILTLVNPREQELDEIDDGE